MQRVLRISRQRASLAVALLLSATLVACFSEPERQPIGTTYPMPSQQASGNAGAPPSQSPSVPPPVIQSPPLQTNYPKTIQDSGVSSAALYLYKQAQAARAAGHADQALALLQRALHVDPRNAFIWQSLADTQLNLQQPDQAEAAAQKSSSLGRGNPYVDAGNWRIIAAARQAQGDTSGAMRAQAQADQSARALSASP